MTALYEVQELATANPERARSCLPATASLLNSVQANLALKTVEQILAVLDPPQRTDVEPLVNELSDLARSEMDGITRSLLQQILSIAEEDPSIIWLLVQDKHVSDLLEKGTKLRILTYSLIGHSAHPSALRLAVDRMQHEPRRVKEALENGLQRSAQTSARWLDADDSDPERREAAIENLYLLSSKVPELASVHADTLVSAIIDSDIGEQAAKCFHRLGSSDGIDLSKQVPALLRLMKDNPGDVRPAMALGSALRTSPNHASALCEKFCPRLPVASEKRREQIMEMMGRLGAGQPELVLEYLDEILDAAQKGPLAVELTALEVLRYCSASGSLPGHAAPFLIDRLDSENKQVRERACLALRYVPLNPLPDALVTCRDDPEPAVRQAANWVPYHGNSSYEVEPFPVAGVQGSVLAGLDDETYLKYRVGDGRWMPLGLDERQQRVFRELAVGFQDGDNNTVILPHYRPSVATLAGVELAGQLWNERATIAVYTEGTGDHWGSKEDIKNELRNLGYSSEAGVTGAATQFSQALTACYIGNNGELKRYWTGKSDCELLITRSLSDLKKAGSLDAIIVNAPSRLRRINLIDQLNEDYPDVPLISIFSLYTRCEWTQGFSRFGPPSELLKQSDTIIPVATTAQFEGGGDRTDGGQDQIEITDVPATRGQLQFQSLTTKKTISIEQLATESLNADFNEAFGSAKSLDEPETADIYRSAMYRMYKLRAICTPLDRYDEWAKIQQLASTRHIPDTIDEMINSLELEGEDSAQMAHVPGTLMEITDHLESIRDTLYHSNPKYDRIRDLVQDGYRRDENIVILFTRRWILDSFVLALENEEDISVEHLEEAGVFFRQPRTLRTVENVDRLVIPEVLPPAYTGFYFHPEVNDVTVLVYGQHWEQRIQSQAARFVTELNRILSADSGTAIVPVPEIELEGEVISEFAERGSDSSIGSNEDLLTSFWNVLGKEQEAQRESDRTSSRHPVQVLTESGEELEFAPSENVLHIHGAGTLTGPEYQWTSPARLSPSDEFIRIPLEIRRQLFRERLVQHYEDGYDGTELVTALRTWWEELNKIRQEYPSLSRIYRLLKRSGFERKYSTMRVWFASASKADDPLVLVERQDLVIGPNRKSDIQLIGDALNNTALKTEAELIHAAMKMFRKRNTEIGVELNDQILRLVADPDSNWARKHTQRYTVSDVKVLK